MKQTRRNFTWFAKLTDVCDSLPAEYQGEMTMAIIHYGTHGTEPKFSNPLLNAVFAGVREDIDNSVLWREDRKSQKRNEKGQFASKSTETKTPVETVNEPCVAVTADTVTVTDGSTDGNRPTIPSKAKPSKANLSHSKKGKERAKKFAPPSPLEVQAYAKEWTSSRGGVDVFSAKDAEQFVSFYTAKGWKVGSTSMKDWKAAVRTWILRNEHDKEASGDETRVAADAFKQYD